MPRKKKKFNKKAGRTYYIVSGQTQGEHFLEAQPENVQVVDYATVTTRGGGGGKYVTTRRVRHILGEDPRESYANPVLDKQLRKYFKPIGEDLRGVFVGKDGTVTAAKYLNGATALKHAPKFLNLQSKETVEDMGDGVGLRSEAATGASAPSAAAADRGESDDDFLPDYSDCDSDEIEFRTDAIALKEAGDAEIAALLDDDFDSDAMEEFGELQDDFVSFAIAEEEKHPRLVEDEEHLKVAADFEEKRQKLMYEAGIDDGEDGDDEDIPFGFGMNGEGGNSDSEDEEEAAERRRQERAERLENGDNFEDDDDVGDFSHVIGAAERYRQRFVDEHFDVAVRREYDNEEEWGEIGEEDVKNGGIKPTSNLFTELMQEFLDQPEERQKLYCRSKEITPEELEKGKRVALQHGAVDLPDITEEEYFNKPKRNQWDCATIVSTYSNLENHPSIIDGDDMSSIIMLSSKTGMPIVSAKAKRKQRRKQRQAQEDAIDEEEEEELSGEDYVGSDDDSDDESVMTTMSSASVSVRSKNETAAEKRARKAAIKEARRIARVCCAPEPLLDAW